MTPAEQSYVEGWKRAERRQALEFGAFFWLGANVLILIAMVVWPPLRANLLYGVHGGVEIILVALLPFRRRVLAYPTLSLALPAMVLLVHAENIHLDVTEGIGGVAFLADVLWATGLMMAILLLLPFGKTARILVSFGVVLILCTAYLPHPNTLRWLFMTTMSISGIVAFCWSSDRDIEETGRLACKMREIERDTTLRLTAERALLDDQVAVADAVKNLLLPPGADAAGWLGYARGARGTGGAIYWVETLTEGHTCIFLAEVQGPPTGATMVSAALFGACRAPFKVRSEVADQGLDALGGRLKTAVSAVHTAAHPVNVLALLIRPAGLAFWSFGPAFTLVTAGGATPLKVGLSPWTPLPAFGGAMLLLSARTMAALAKDPVCPQRLMAALGPAASLKARRSEVLAIVGESDDAPVDLAFLLLQAGSAGAHVLEELKVVGG